MHKTKSAFAAFILLIPLVASGQNNRSAVSVTGSDAATCTVPDPCRTFGTALSKTNLGGEVIALSSGGYGPFNVTQAATIVSPSGIYAAISSSSSSPVAIYVSTPSGQSVVLRGLYLNGSLGGVAGVYVSTAGTITYVEHMVIANYTSDGDEGVRNGDGDVRVTDSLIRNNYHGILLTHDTNTARSRATIDHCRLEGNTAGVSLSNLSDATVSNTLFAGNFRGVSIDGTPPVDGRATIKDSVITQNSVGIFAISSSAIVRVARSLITQNTRYALDIQQGAQATSAGNNVMIDNAANETFTSTFGLK